jgi:hypothetical protein
MLFSFRDATPDDRYVRPPAGVGSLLASVVGGLFFCRLPPGVLLAEQLEAERAGGS